MFDAPGSLQQQQAQQQQYLQQQAYRQQLLVGSGGGRVSGQSSLQTATPASTPMQGAPYLSGGGAGGVREQRKLLVLVFSRTRLSSELFCACRRVLGGLHSL
jgi:hypothetical protein